MFELFMPLEQILNLFPELVLLAAVISSILPMERFGLLGSIVNKIAFNFYRARNGADLVKKENKARL